VAGTSVIVAYAIFTISGVYWCSDVVRDGVDGMLGVRRPPPEAAAATPPCIRGNGKSSFGEHQRLKVSIESMNRICRPAYLLDDHRDFVMARGQ
jgi:hypothetical protein